MRRLPGGWLLHASPAAGGDRSNGDENCRDRVAAGVLGTDGAGG